MRIIPSFACVVLATSLSAAATVTNITACNSTISFVAETQCSVSPPIVYQSYNGIIEAQTSGSITVSGNVLSGSVDQSTYDFLDNAVSSLTINSSARTDLNATVQSAGLLREGLATLTVSRFFNVTGASEALTSFAAAGIRSICDVGAGYPFTVCMIGTMQVDPNQAVTLTVPFTLGQQFDFTLISDTASFTGYGTSSGDTRLALTLAFFEADGVTPVTLTDVTAVPEPASLALLGIGILLLTSRSLVRQ